MSINYHGAVTMAREVMGVSGSSWDDLVQDLQDPEFLREYLTESVRVATIDTIVSAIDEARASAGLSRSAIARAVGAEPEIVRNVFTPGEHRRADPSLGTLAQLAAAVGMRIAIEPLPEAERVAVPTSLRTGRPTDTAVRWAAGLREPGTAVFDDAAPESGAHARAEDAVWGDTGEWEDIYARSGAHAAPDGPLWSEPDGGARARHRAPEEDDDDAAPDDAVHEDESLDEGMHAAMA